MALVAIGCVLVLLAISWRLAIAPALKVVPTNIDLLLFYDGTFTNFVNPPGQPVVGAKPAQVPVRIERRVFSRPIDSTPAVAIMETDTQVVSQQGNKTLSSRKQVYALDRNTGKMVHSRKADRERSGYYLLFPYNTPRGPVPLWSELTGRTYPAKYQGSEKVDKVDIYDFAMSFGGQPLAAPPEGYPAELTGALLKQMLSMPGLAVADTQAVRPSFTGSSSVDLKTEPKSGTIVDTSRSRESVSITVKGPSGALLVTRVLSTLEYEQTPTSVEGTAGYALDQITKLRLQFLYLPLGLLLLGIALVLIGFFAGVKPAAGHGEGVGQTRSE